MKFNHRLTFYQRNPFVFILVIPEAIRGGVALRDDPLNSNRAGLKQSLREFGAQWFVRKVEKVNAGSKV